MAPLLPYVLGRIDPAFAANSRFSSVAVEPPSPSTSAHTSAAFALDVPAGIALVLGGLLVGAWLGHHDICTSACIIVVPPAPTQSQPHLRK
ncbi:hypothetical protein DFH07DRAFT_963164 [Mycena maculata]|uniref:Uncharacterized protein n=1 Tax=Mycena maculata TaxID=230809 RepID=A0AAD7IMZ9_9AGAR|nr:hypothetical protein DFH07DRAFT_963164 [Mycena maculata]